MNLEEHTTPERLEHYAFVWSLFRMVLAAVSLFFGAVPIAYRAGGIDGIAAALLPLFWLVSGAAAGYLWYRWYRKRTHHRQLFGRQTQSDAIVFFVMVLSGVNLGYAAIGSNIGMVLAYNLGIAGLLFKITAVGYLVCAYYLWQRWSESGEQLFPKSAEGDSKEKSGPANTNRTDRVDHTDNAQSESDRQASL